MFHNGNHGLVEVSVWLNKYQLEKQGNCWPATSGTAPHTPVVASCRTQPAPLSRSCAGPGARHTHRETRQLILVMIVSTDQQAFSVTILVKAEEEEIVKVKQEEVEMVEARGHEGLVLEGLAGLREQGLLLDTRLWAESQSFQVNTKGLLHLIELTK